MNDIDILKKFLNFPLGSGEEILGQFATLNGAIHRGNEKNDSEEFVYIPGKRENKVLLVARADTYPYFTDTDDILKSHEFLQDGNHIRSGSTGFGIGADNRAGCAILWLLRDMGHSLLITKGGVEKGAGSNWLMDCNPDIANEINNIHQFVVQFTLGNSKIYKTYTVGTWDFVDYIEKETNYTEPDIFGYEDIVSLCHKITGVNLSIGYYQENTENESIVTEEWLNTLNLCRKWLRKEYLPRFLRPKYQLNPELPL